MLAASTECLCQTKLFHYKVELDTGKGTNKLYVSYEISGVNYIDSFVAGKKKIIQSRTLPQPVSALLFSNLKGFVPTIVFLANNTISVNLSKNSVGFTDKQLQRDFEYLTTNDRIRPTYFPLYGELVEKKDSIGLKNLSEIFDSLKTDDIRKASKYFRANSSSLLSLFSFSRFSSFSSDYATIEPDFDLLPEWAKLSPGGKIIQSKIFGAKNIKLNTQAPPFEQQNSKGEKVNLKDYLGKYILLDFWASWCAPCRAEHPDLIKAYQSYNSRNFEIIAVSLDQNKDAWLAAIKKDGIMWPNLSDLKGQENDVAVKYGVQSIPANFLINPDGKIIALNLSGKELLQKLNELIK